jgi:hypothetical protein
MSTPTRRKLPRGAYRIQEEPTSAPASPEMAQARRMPLSGRLSTGALTQPRRGLSLRARLLMALVGVALLPLVATAVGGVQLAHTSLMRQGRHILASSASATGKKIDGYLAEVRSSLVSSRQQVAQLVAADPAIGETTHRAIQDVLGGNSTALSLAATAATAYLDTTGHVVVSDQSGEEGEDLSGSPAVKAALAQALTADCQNDPANCIVLSGVAFDPSASSELRETLQVVAPVYAAGAGVGAAPIGALRVRFPLDKIVAWIASDADGQGGGGLLVERSTGLILASSIPPGASLTFSSLVPLSSAAAQSLKASGRYTAQLKTNPIPGLSLSQLTKPCTQTCTFSAGAFAGTGVSSMLYARVDLANGPKDSPWVYLLGRPQSALSATADNLWDFSSFPDLSLAQTAMLVALVALVLSLICGILTARWTSSWLTTSVEQLSATASAFLAFTADQRQAAEEQRHRLTAARAALHDIHRTAGELSEALVRAISYAEDNAPGRTLSASAATQPDAANRMWWTQWSLAMRDRLTRQHRVCNGLADEARIMATAASNMRQRGSAVATRASAIEAALFPGGVALANRMASSNAAGAGQSGPVGVSGRFRTGTLRLVLLGLLLALGLLPSLGFVGTTNLRLRGNLASQSNLVLFGEGKSRGQAVDALLAQQQQQVKSRDKSYQSMMTYGSNTTSITAAIISNGLATEARASDLGTDLLELADPSGRVIAASTPDAIGTSVANLPIFPGPNTRRDTTTSDAYFDPATQSGWYYVAHRIRDPNQRNVIGVAIGKFSLAPIWTLLAQQAAGATAESGAFTLVVEPSDGMVLADSRQPGGVFESATPLAQSALAQLWSQGRYPNGQTPRVQNLPEVASQVRSSGASANSAPFTGSSGSADAPLSEYRLIPLDNAPWDLVAAQPITAATAVADQLNHYDLLLSLLIVALTAGLAFVLGQSIIVPVRRLRSRFRQAARRLVAITRRQDEAAHRQEAALPPIEATAQLLALATEEVAQLLFAPHAALPQPAYSAAPFAPQGSGSDTWPAMNASGAYSGAPGPVTDQALALGGPLPLAPDQPPMEALRRARILADDWSLRQQRILADLATALNATDELSRGSVEGQGEATGLANVAVDLLASAR